MKKRILVPIFLAAMALPLSLANRANGVDAQFIGDYNDRATYLSYGVAVNGELANEGFVLLKNDGTLPLEKGAKVSIVGKSSVNLAKGGGGSGSGSTSSGVTEINMKKSLTDAGFEVNPTTDSF